MLFMVLYILDNKIVFFYLKGNPGIKEDLGSGASENTVDTLDAFLDLIR